MKVLTVLSLLAAVAMLVPVAVAQNPTAQVTVMRNDGAPNDAVVEIPESRRMNIPIKVAVNAGGFVCAQPAILAIEVLLQPYPDHWAGASVNPGAARVEFAAGQPGTAPIDKDATYPNGDIQLELFWGDDRPNVGAKQTYRLTTESSWESSTCAPPPPQPEEGSMQISASMPDIVIDENSTGIPNDCALDPSLPECQTATTTAEGESPTVQAFGLTALLAGVAFVLRRRRE